MRAARATLHWRGHWAAKIESRLLVAIAQLQRSESLLSDVFQLRKRKMNFSKNLPAILMALMLAGCAAPKMAVVPSNPSEAGQAPVNYRKFVQNHLQQTLVDPGSLQGLVISAPKLSKCEEITYGGGGIKSTLHGWLVSVQFNAKNTSGGYSGKQLRDYWFQGERIKLVTSHPPGTEYGRCGSAL